MKHRIRYKGRRLLSSYTVIWDDVAGTLSNPFGDTVADLYQQGNPPAYTDGLSVAIRVFSEPPGEVSWVHSGWKYVLSDVSHSAPDLLRLLWPYDAMPPQEALPPSLQGIRPTQPIEISMPRGEVV